MSKSLPWYAAYLSFVNPLAAGAVLVGERIFRNQIQQVSSATYRVRGTLDDPDVKFVGIFGRPAEPTAQVSVVEAEEPPKEPAGAQPADEPDATSEGSIETPAELR